MLVMDRGLHITAPAVNACEEVMEFAHNVIVTTCYTHASRRNYRANCRFIR